MRRTKKMKGIEAQRVKYPTPFRAINVLRGDEEQSGKGKGTKRKKPRVDPQLSYPGPFSRLIRRAGIVR